MHACNCIMSSAVISVFVLCLSWSYGQGEEVCISNFAEFENALLSNPINQYQIARAYFPARREINPVCVTSYYYIGINGSDAVKQSCPTDMTADEDGMLSGCSKWKWCINSFYIGLNLAQLQDFSLFMLLNIDSEVELELPPVCNIQDKDVLCEYLQRITLSLYNYARDEGQLGKGTEFIGFASRYVSNSDLEELSYLSKPTSIDSLSEDSSNNIDLYILDTTILCLSLMALPVFSMSLVYVLYVDYTKKNKLNGATEDNSSNLRFMMCSVLVLSFLGNAVMLYCQLVAIIKNPEWFYLLPYVWLWIFIIINFFISVKIVYIIKDDQANRCCFTKLPPWLEGMFLGTITMTVQLSSWHLVFMLCGFVLNPLRAFLYSVVIMVTLICSIVLLSVIMKITVILIYRTKVSDKKWFKEYVRRPVVLMEDKKFPYIDIVFMFSLVMLLIYAHAYSVFILQISIGSSTNETVEEIARVVIPKLFLIVIAWYLPHLFLKPEETWWLWWKYTDGKTKK